MSLAIPPSIKHSPLGALTDRASHVTVSFPELAFYAVSATGKQSRDIPFLAFPLTRPVSHSLLRRLGVCLVGRR